MKSLKWLVVLLSVCLLFGCASDGKNGETVYVEVPADPPVDDGEVVLVRDLSGISQKGRCDGNGQLLIWPLFNGTLGQTGDHFIGLTANDGSYEVPADLKVGADEYVFVYFKGNCDDEANGGSGHQELFGYRKVSDVIGNVNVLTKIAKPIADWLIKDELSITYGKVKESIEESERLVLAYLSLASNGTKFSEMNLENQTGDIVALASSVVLYGRTDVEASDYMSLISKGIMNNDLDLKNQIQLDYNSLPVLNIKNNLETSYASINKTIDTPKFWRLKHDPYFADILERNMVVVGTDNLEDNSTCSFDQSTYNTFYIPYVFDAGIESAKYIALNLDGDISIYTKIIDGNGKPAPGILVTTFERLKENLLTEPVALAYNGLLAENHGLTAGTEYYIQIRSDEDFTLSTSCEGGFLPFGWKLASDDEGLTTIGTDNNTPWWIKSGVKVILFN